MDSTIFHEGILEKNISINMIPKGSSRQDFDEWICALHPLISASSFRSVAPEWISLEYSDRELNRFPFVAVTTPGAPTARWPNTGRTGTWSSGRFSGR